MSWGYVCEGTIRAMYARRAAVTRTCLHRGPDGARPGFDSQPVHWIAKQGFHPLVRAGGGAGQGRLLGYPSLMGFSGEVSGYFLTANQGECSRLRLFPGAQRYLTTPLPDGLKGIEMDPARVELIGGKVK